MDRSGIQEKVGLKIDKHRQGQGLVEFALLLPILVLVVFGIFEIGRAFFTLVAITNAAREGARVYTIYPSQTTVTDIQAAAKREAGNQGLDIVKVLVAVTCSGTPPNCAKEQPIRVTVSYNFAFTFRFLFLQSITLSRYAEMMVP